MKPRAATPRPWEWLYDAVGLGMWAMTNARFDLQILGDAVPQVASGQLWVVTHRAETDVPVIGGLLMVRGGMLRRRPMSRVHFAARDDLFEPGVVSAGLRMPVVLARMAWPLSPGPWLPRVRAHPIRRPTGLKLGQALRGLDPTVALDDVISSRLVDQLARRATAIGRTPPGTVGQARVAAFAEDLWQDVTADDLGGGVGRSVWRAHVARTAGDVRRLIGLVRAGEPLVVFPEGRVSSDGDIGPVAAVLDVIARRGAPAALLPVGIAYDPLRRGRTTVAISVGPAIPAGQGPLGPLVLTRLRAATPVTVGQIVARELVAAAASDVTLHTRGLVEALKRTHEHARRDGRPVVRGLTSPGRRGRSLARALHMLQSRGLIDEQAAGVLRIHSSTVLADPLVARLATEDRAVWNTDPGFPET